jgi:predicted acylesterase/phospholipase RssA
MSGSDVADNVQNPVATVGSLRRQPDKAHTAVLRAKSHEVLILTSGGADGAFGAGALVSWTRSGRRPVFDVVSGVSTGALQAPLAFLGSDYDTVLEDVFTGTKTGEILASNGFSGLFGSGLYGSGPLRGRLARILDNTVLDRIADAHRSGRRLYVTTTDLTNGKTVVWDMGAIAASAEPDRQYRFISILLASIAVPGLIDPVTISRSDSPQLEVHGDGGVYAPVPLQRSMLISDLKSRHVTVIANGHVSDTAATVSSSKSTLPLARRAVSLLLRRMLALSSDQARSLANKERVSFSLVSLPLTVPEAVDPFAFDPKEMGILFESGKKLERGVWGRRKN